MSNIGIRNLTRKFHSITGLIIGIPFAIICLSGAILVFEPQILKLKNPDFYAVCHDDDDEFLDIDIIYDKVKKQLPENTGLGELRIGQKGETWRIEVTSLRNAELFVDPYTGKVIGMTDHDKGFFFIMRRIHRWMFDLYDRNSDEICWGKMITGCVSLLSLPLLIAGTARWWPRRRKNIGIKFKINTKAGIQRLAYDIHANGGMYIMVILFVLAATGLTWSFDWYRDAFYRMAGSEYKSDKGNDTDDSIMPDYSSWQKAFVAISEMYPQYKWIKITHEKANVSIYKYGDVYKSDVIKFSEESGMIKERITYSNTDRQRKTRGWIVALHEGLWLGVTSQIITFVAALAGACLPFTGYYLHYRRKTRKSKQTNYQ